MKLLTIFSQISGVFDDIEHPNKDGSLGSDQLASVTEFVFIAVGIISVIMVIVGGYWYTLSGGDPQRVARAKKTILWSVIGLAISISAWTIVNFVIGST